MRLDSKYPRPKQLWAAQTPQAFDVKLLKQCHAEGRRWEVTDDAALFEKWFERANCRGRRDKFKADDTVI